MRQGFVVSRRKLVTLAAGSLVASAAPVTNHALTSSQAGGAAQAVEARRLLAQSQRRMFDLLQRVRRAHGAGSRAQAFAEFTSALRTYHSAELSFAATTADTSTVRRESGAATLYRQRPPEDVLANVIVRELQARPKSDAAWLTRLGDLEAIIAEQARKRLANAYEPVSVV